MPLRTKDCLCQCMDCILDNLNGKLFDNRICYLAHHAAVLAKEKDIVLSFKAPTSRSQNTGLPSFPTPHISDITASTTSQEFNPISEILPHVTNASCEQPWSLKKKDFSHYVTRSMEKLAVIQQRVDECFAILQTDQNFWDMDNLTATICELRKALAKHKRGTPQIVSLKQTICLRLDKLEEKLSTLSILDEATAARVYNTDQWFIFPFEHMPVVVQSCFILIIMCHIILNLSRRATEIIIGLLRILLESPYKPEHSTLSLVGRSVLNQIPKTLRLILSKVNIGGRTTTYAVCPRCHYLYSPRPISGSEEVVYPEYCTHILCDEGMCNEPLNMHGSPIKAFIYHEFDDYVASLLSRADLEHRIDDACDVTMKSIEQCPLFTRSIFDSEFIRTFEGPDSTPDRRRLFIDRGDDARLVFSLNFDFFHPEGMRVQGATISSGLISMACLSLGLDICFLPENMYIAGIIPGPKEPNGEQCNHYLKPLISDLERSWNTSVFFSRTAKYRQGRLARSAIVLSVNDLPATRKVAGLANHNSHHYCSICRNYGRQTLSQTDIENWKLRDPQAMHHFASDWLNTQSLKGRSSIFDTHGVCWSELWCLPYWNPQHQLVVDPMHCIFKGLIHRHVHDILELTTVKAKAKVDYDDAFSYSFSLPVVGSVEDKTIKQVTQIHKLLLAPLLRQEIIHEETNDSDDPHNNFEDVYQTLSKKLMQKCKDALEFICKDIDPTVKGQKIMYVSTMIEWRKTQPLTGERLPIKLVTEDTIQFIQKVIKTTIKPSWISSAPYNFGNAAAGMIKAEEWRNLSMIFLPIALIALWGGRSKHPSAAIAGRASAILEHSMLLFNAAWIISLQNIDDDRIASYQKLMLSYIRELQNLHPKSSIFINHHMALHIPLFLKNFGPTRSWWTFLFERLIGILQRESTNNALGIIESTMLHTFLKKVKMRFWLSQHSSKPLIADCGRLLDSMITWRRDLEDDVNGLEAEHTGLLPGLYDVLPI